MYGGDVELLRNLPLCGEVRFPVLTGLRERAMRSFRTIDGVGPCERDLASQSVSVVWCISGVYGRIEFKNVCAIWSRNHGVRSKYRRDDEKL